MDDVNMKFGVRATSHEIKINLVIVFKAQPNTHKKQKVKVNRNYFFDLADNFFKKMN